MTVHEVGAKLLLDQAVPGFCLRPLEIKIINQKKKDLTILIFSSL